MGDRSIQVVFVCWGNICRSPVAERVAERAAQDAGLDGVKFTSAATSREELGSPMDHRAARTLEAAGYRADDHVAHQITAAEIAGADLVIAMEQIHVAKMLALSPKAENLVLLSAFYPGPLPDSGVPDPWYGPDSAFDDTLAVVEGAMPGVLDRVREIQSSH